MRFFGEAMKRRSDEKRGFTMQSASQRSKKKKYHEQNKKGRFAKPFTASTHCLTPLLTFTAFTERHGCPRETLLPHALTSFQHLETLCSVPLLTASPSPHVIVVANLPRRRRCCLACPHKMCLRILISLMEEATYQTELNIDGLSSVPVDQDLVGVSVSNVDEAYKLYNDYAYRVGFSVRKGKQCYKGSTKTVKMKKFLCSKAGHKVKVHGVKSYSKMDLRTGCGASVQFDVDGNGVWTVTKHEKGHNHELCPSDKSHLLRSHRRVVKNQFLCLNDLKSEVALADDIRLLKQQSEGSPSVGVASSIWAVEMTRKFQRLIVSCQDNNVARQICEEAFENAKRRIEAEVGCVHIEEFVVSSSNDIV